ncbi:MAG: malectin [Verrucomicrobiales bacterium]|nr:malectin [Verrucomicrobiales bacterium]
MSKKNFLLNSTGCLFISMLAAVLLAGCESAEEKGGEKQAAAVAPAAVTPAPAPAVEPAPAAPTAPVAPAASPVEVKPAEAAPASSAIRIDAGADASFTDSNGNVWLADTGFEGGDVSVREDDMKIENTTDAGIYRSEHWGMSSFSQPLPNGKYVVKLHFAETYDGISGPEGRVFSFNVEGQEFKDFDVWVKAGGPRRAYIETVPVTIADGKLDITFESGVDNPEINGIEIIPAP